MTINYKASSKELFKIRNDIILHNWIPVLLKQGFTKSLFSTSWYGKNDLGDYSYELYRITNYSNIEIINIYINKRDKWIKILRNGYLDTPQE